MRKMWILTSILLFAFVLVSSFGSTALAQSKNNMTNFTVEDYVNYLDNYSIEDAYASGVTDPDLAIEAQQNAKNILQQFLELSIEEQHIFINIISSPELLESIYSGNVDNLGIYSEYVSIGSRDSTAINYPSSINALADSSRQIQHEFTMTLLDIDWTKYRITGRYSYNSNGATEALSVDAVVVQNYNPFVVTGLDNVDHYVANGWYYADSTFHYQIGLLDWGVIQLGNAYVGVVGDKNGKFSGYGYTD